MFTTRFATGREQIEAIRPAWLALERRCPRRDITFQRYGWCKHWMRVYGAKQSRDVAVIASVWRDDEMVALLPLQTGRNRIGLRKAWPLGHPQGQYSAILADASIHPARALQLILAAMHEKPMVDLASFEHVPADIGSGQGGVEAEHSFLLELSPFADFAEYEASLSRNQRKGLKRKLKKLEERGETGFRIAAAGDPGYDSLCRDMFEWKSHTLAASGRIGSNIVCDRFQRFITGLPEAARDGLEPLCHVMTVDERPVAAQLMFREDKTLIGYFSAYDPGFAAFSPGRLEMHRLVEWMLDNDIARYDFLANSEEYKRTIANREVPLYRLQVPLTLRGRMLAGVSSRPLRRYIKKSLELLPRRGRQAAASAARRVVQRAAGSTQT